MISELHQCWEGDTSRERLSIRSPEVGSRLEEGIQHLLAPTVPPPLPGLEQEEGDRGEEKIWNGKENIEWFLS